MTERFEDNSWELVCPYCGNATGLFPDCCLPDSFEYDIEDEPDAEFVPMTEILGITADGKGIMV